MTEFFIAAGLPKKIRAKAVAETKLMGKTAEEILANEFSGANYFDYGKINGFINKGKNTVVFLYPTFPFAEKKKIETVVNFLEKSKKTAASFCGGIAVKAGESARGAVETYADCGFKFAVTADYASALEFARRKILKKHIENGVLIENLENIYIDYDAVIAAGAKICQCNVIKGKTEIGADTVIEPFCNITDSTIGKNVKCVSSTLAGATVGDFTNVGPYAYLRPNSVIGRNCRIGDFVEIKNSTVGDNTKVSHLAYVGDATVGANVNVGCGVVFVNYDGKGKFRTTVGDGSFLGSNCNFIAPLSIGKNVYVAAGSTVTVDLADNDFCVAREREYVKHEWKRP